jgi:2-dehydro-3-deoxyphosphogluconate aldolase/(4S)-4-hydroxy-2-oxoglutarate aldolase
VSLETTPEFIRAGAAAVAAGGNLVKKSAIASKNYDELTSTARQFVEAVAVARRG